MKKIIISIFTLCALASATAQQISESIKINQIGFYPDGPKVAIVANSQAKKFFLIGVEKKDTAFRGSLVSLGKIGRAHV